MQGANIFPNSKEQQIFDLDEMDPDEKRLFLKVMSQKDAIALAVEEVTESVFEGCIRHYRELPDPLDEEWVYQYLKKSPSSEELFARLTKTLSRAEELIDIYLAWDEKNNKEVINQTVALVEDRIELLFDLIRECGGTINLSAISLAAYVAKPDKQAELQILDAKENLPHLKVALKDLLPIFSQVVKDNGLYAAFSNDSSYGRYGLTEIDDDWPFFLEEEQTIPSSVDNQDDYEGLGKIAKLVAQTAQKPYFGILDDNWGNYIEVFWYGMHRLFEALVEVRPFSLEMKQYKKEIRRRVLEVLLEPDLNLSLFELKKVCSQLNLYYKRMQKE
ncbi:MAG TPA: hypothetical protein IAD17_01450 [Candidatus Coprovicinus avistercoris]|uniref:Uncharacterized protein n=1 Tax=Candidatus Coprovicinus avistercoris TaxID=2840754 RepID=A0A9D1HVY9_9ACTN|nr:hypothetical protein [Candidatus Coprovicinus avistercoris]